MDRRWKGLILLLVGFSGSFMVALMELIVSRGGTSTKVLLTIPVCILLICVSGIAMTLLRYDPGDKRGEKG